MRVGLLLWLLPVIAEGVERPCRFTSFEVDWLREDGSLRFPSYTGAETRGNDDIGAEKEGSAEESSCRFLEDSGELVCRDAIDFPFVQTVRTKRLNRLLVESYNRNDTTKRRLSNKRAESVVPAEKATGELRLRDIRVEMSTTLDLREAEQDRFLVDGEVFSNRIIRVGWKYAGEVHVERDEGGLVAKVAVDAREWRLEAQVAVDPGGAAGGFFGRLHHLGGSIPFGGSFRVDLLAGVEASVAGALAAPALDVAGDFTGRVTRGLAAAVTVPEDAFAGMSIRDILFRNSFFFGDFHNRSFEGISLLETIAFSKSTMEYMPEYGTVFRGTNLRAIYIEDCNTPSIATGADCRVPSLELLSFAGSGFLEFSERSFRWLACSNLTYLSFREANLKLIGNESIWAPVRNTLKYLDLSYSTLTQESALRQFLNGARVTHLSLAGLQLKRVPRSALLMVGGTLEYLSLRKNSFEKILGENMLVSILNFPESANLKELDLHGCRINYVEKRSFDSLPNLRWLDLSGNSIVNLGDGWAAAKPSLTYLNLSFNGLVARGSPMNLLDADAPLDLSAFDRLEALDLSNNPLRHEEGQIATLNPNIRYLSLCKCGLRSLNDSLLQSLSNVRELDLSGNPDLGRSISLGQMRNLTALRKLHLACNGIANLTFEGNDDLVGLEYLDLSSNYIKVVRSEVLAHLPNLKVLKLSRNNVLHLPTDLHLFARSLESVHLDNNKIDRIQPTSVPELGRLREFALGNNPFVCGCFVIDFLRRLVRTDAGHFLCPEVTEAREAPNVTARLSRKNGDGVLREVIHPFGEKRKVYLYPEGCARVRDFSEYDYQCYSRARRKNVPFVFVREDLDECREEAASDYFGWESITVTVAVLGCFFVGFVWWKWWNFRTFAKMLKNAAVVSFINSDESERMTSFEYDAFISYTDSDRLWVTENLIPNLEKFHDVKICLHERDFQVGLSILENIVTSIDKSKSIILVLSQAFFKSQWCQYEMHLAYHRLLETRRDKMILILLEPIPRTRRPKTLQYLMMTMTYIQWPGNERSAAEVDLFWKRLFKALLHINQI